MATVAPIQVPQLPPGELAATADQRVTLHHVPWSHYEAELAVRGEKSVPRISFLDGKLEFMSPSRDHERIAAWIARLAEIFAEEHGVELSPYGSWTLKHPELAGAEPDECCIVGEDLTKERPDLVIEVVWTSGGVDQLESYVEIDVAMIDCWLERKADGIFFSDDWGTQTDLLMSPADWRKYYKPAYERIFRRAREGGVHVWFHSCGNITAILPDLVDLGVNVLNPVQPQAMDVRSLAREFGGKICFYGGVDSQGTLTSGRPEDVRREVHMLVELFGKYNGGYIGAASQSIMPETPLDNVIALYEAFLEYQSH